MIGHYHVTDWLTALGTVGAVIAAVGIAIWSERQRRQDLRDRARRQPRLRLERDAAYLATNAGYQKLRLAVVNEPGHEAAHDVLVSVEFINEGSGVHHYPLNMTLPWSGVFNRSQLLSLTVPAGGRRHVNLGEFIEWVREPGFNAAPVFKVAQQTSGGIEGRLERPSIFYLTLTASNADASYWVANLGFEGRNEIDPTQPTNVSLEISEGSGSPLSER